MVNPSSDTLHPGSGARFAMKRVQGGPTAQAPQALRYEVKVYLPQEQTLTGILELCAQGKASVEGIDPEHWAYQETLKLGRVLKRTQVGSLLRWRPGPT